MKLMEWNPGREFSQLQDRINRLFTDAYGRGGDEGLMNQGTWIPAVDIYQNNKHEIVLKAELPDMKREDIEVTIDDSTLTISGEKKVSEEVKEGDFQRIERAYGRFSRSFSLPPNIDASKLSAEYEHGVLTIRLPLREEAKPRRVEIKAAA